MKFATNTYSVGTIAVFSPAVVTRHYEGSLANAAYFIQDAQLVNPALRSLFVEYFRIGYINDHAKSERGEYCGDNRRHEYRITQTHPVLIDLFVKLVCREVDLTNRQNMFFRTQLTRAHKETKYTPQRNIFGNGALIWHRSDDRLN